MSWYRLLPLALGLCFTNIAGICSLVISAVKSAALGLCFTDIAGTIWSIHLQIYIPAYIHMYIYIYIHIHVYIIWESEYKHSLISL